MYKNDSKLKRNTAERAFVRPIKHALRSIFADRGQKGAVHS